MSAREQLLGAVASLREQGPLRIDVLKHRTTPRESAVLILVGVLDDVAAESDGLAAYSSLEGVLRRSRYASLSLSMASTWALELLL